MGYTPPIPASATSCDRRTTPVSVAITDETSRGSVAMHHPRRQLERSSTSRGSSPGRRTRRAPEQSCSRPPDEWHRDRLGQTVDHRHRPPLRTRQGQEYVPSGPFSPSPPASSAGLLSLSVTGRLSAATRLCRKGLANGIGVVKGSSRVTRRARTLIRLMLIVSGRSAPRKMDGTGRTTAADDAIRGRALATIR